MEKLFLYIIDKIDNFNLAWLKKKDRLAEAKKKEYREGKCDYFPFYRGTNTSVFRLGHSNMGISRNYHGKGKFAVLTHGSEDGGLLYAEGSRLRSIYGGKIIKDYDFYKIVTPEEFVDLLKERQGIDLKKGGNTGDAPIYLISCHALKGDDNSNAQHLANYIGRDVYAHSKNTIKGPGISSMSKYKYRKTAVPKVVPLNNFDYIDIFRKNERNRVVYGNLKKKFSGHIRRDICKLPKTIIHPQGEITLLEKTHSRRSSLSGHSRIN